MAGPKRRSIEDRFWSNVDKRDDGCWIYGNNLRYGLISTGGKAGKTISAHKFSYELHKGKVPIGLYVCHTCDVKQCVNPDHLYAGTHEDNTRDIVDRGRQAKNSGRVVKTKPVKRYRNGRFLSKPNREKLIREYASGRFTQMQLAARYRVSQATVSATIRGVHNMGSGGDGKKRTGHFRRKVSVQDAQMIRELYAAGGVTQGELADRFGCTQANVSKLVHTS